MILHKLSINTLVYSVCLCQRWSFSITTGCFLVYNLLIRKLTDSTRVSVTRAHEAARPSDLSELREHCSNVSNCVIGEREMEIVSKSYYREGDTLFSGSKMRNKNRNKNWWTLEFYRQRAFPVSIVIRVRKFIDINAIRLCAKLLLSYCTQYEFRKSFNRVAEVVGIWCESTSYLFVLLQ